MPRVVIWRSAMLSGSETFVLNHGAALTRWQPAYLGATPADSPYWPGTCVVVADDGPPELTGLLLGVTREQLG